MSRILIVGNSHVGAIASGMREVLGNECAENFHFAALPSTFSHMSVTRGHIIVPPEIQNQLSITYPYSETIPLNDYENIVYVAGWCRMDFRFFQVDGKIPPLSSEVIKEILTGPIQTGHLYRRILKEFDRPEQVIYLGAPLVSENHTQFVKAVPLIESEQDLTVIQQAAIKIRKICDDLLTEPGIAKILLPPEHVIGKIGFNTLDRFMRAGVRFNGAPRKSNDRDFAKDDHGNREYGIEISRMLIEFLITD